MERGSKWLPLSFLRMCCQVGSSERRHAVFFFSVCGFFPFYWFKGLGSGRESAFPLPERKHLAIPLLHMPGTRLPSDSDLSQWFVYIPLRPSVWDFQFVQFRKLSRTQPSPFHITLVHFHRDDMAWAQKTNFEDTKNLFLGEEAMSSRWPTHLGGVHFPN